ncbi:hypothetical protein K491DRAFT_464592 [Lophiostoma macrostomum CBS 122681]|uniref:Uncharacterized protein n=1 Tax=Lophiostoma macrostomum CBS 122681 TaxID=1314788 RepID=A0A6A6T7S8_9PLEO|nr:hypothetical protein K491DRAFT_464592 [Lophiostoma macrostomum CBS 122681]
MSVGTSAAKKQSQKVNTTCKPPDPLILTRPHVNVAPCTFPPLHTHLASRAPFPDPHMPMHVYASRKSRRSRYAPSAAPFQRIQHYSPIVLPTLSFCRVPPHRPATTHKVAGLFWTWDSCVGVDGWVERSGKK